MFTERDKEIVRRAIDGEEVNEQELEELRTKLQPPPTTGECTMCRREQPTQKTCIRCGGTGNEPELLNVLVWACLCGNYFASSSQGDLAAQVNTKVSSHEKTHRRSRCPDCKRERVPCMTTVLIPIA